MKTATKHQVLDLLDSLDASEIQQVLSFARNFYRPMKSDLKEREFKSRALSEIQEALKNPVKYAA